MILPFSFVPPEHLLGYGNGLRPNIKRPRLKARSFYYFFCNI